MEPRDRGHFPFRLFFAELFGLVVAAMLLSACVRAGFDPGADVPPETDGQAGSLDAATDVGTVHDGLPDGGGELGPPELVQGLGSSITQMDPCLSADGLELYFTVEESDGTHNIWMATRKTRADSFSAPQQVAGINSASDDKSPSISADGLFLYFDSTRPGGLGGRDLYVAKRSSTSEPFSNPTALATLNSDGWDSDPAISADGLVLYWQGRPAGSSGDFNVWVAARPDTMSSFGDLKLLDGASSGETENDPAIASDGLTLYFLSTRPGGKGGPDIWMVTRPGVTEDFSNPTNVAIINSDSVERDPFISFDGCELYFVSDRDGGTLRIWVSRRPCAGR